MAKAFNFNPGPSILPEEVFQQASKAVAGYDSNGLSILEISHRSPEFVEIMDKAVSSVKELLGLSDQYEVLFLQGGASTQFFMSAANILNEGDKAGYVDTGSWSAKAIKEAKFYGDVSVIASSKDKNYTYIPKGYAIDNDLSYLHITSNNTIFGTQFHAFPETDVKIIADMSSDIFSRPLDMSKFGIVYAGAQKNMGPAGVALVIIDKEFLAGHDKDLPTMQKYQTHIAKNSSFNTPPVFSIYTSMLTLQWVKKNGGLKGMEVRNAKKASTLYTEIDRNSLFYGPVAQEDRSLMNVTFLLHNDELMADFIDLAKEYNCVGIKGHRSVGGFRASIYNAMSQDGVDALVAAMKEFEKRNA